MFLTVELERFLVSSTKTPVVVNMWKRCVYRAALCQLDSYVMVIFMCAFINGTFYHSAVRKML